MNNSRIINSVRNILTGFLGQFIQVILGFISRTIFIKFLATEYLGISGLFTNILSILSLAELGVGSAIIYALYKPLAENDKEKVSSLMFFYSKAYKMIGLIIMILGLLLLPFLHYFITDVPSIKESIYIIYLLYLFNTVITYFFSYKNSIIIADQKNYISTSINYIILFFQNIIQIIILSITRNFLLYLIIQSVCSLIYNIIISIIADKMYPYMNNKDTKLDINTKKDLIINIKALIVIKLSGILVNNTDNIIISYFSGLSVIGLCSNYNLLVSIFNNVLSQIFSGITASIGNLNAKETVEKKEHFFNILNLLNFWLFTIATICIIVLSNDFISLWLGENYILPRNISIIIGINFYIVGMQNSVWMYKNTMGMFTYGKYLILLTATLNLILSIALGKYIGLFGILISTSIARVLTNVWYDPYSVYKYGFNKNPIKYFKKYIKFSLLLIIQLFITLHICELIKVVSLKVFVIKILVCIIVPNILMLGVFHKTIEFKYLLSIINKIFITLINKIENIEFKKLLEK